jgi:hypothetical protein
LFDTGPVDERPASGSPPPREVEASAAAVIGKSNLPETVGKEMSWADIGTCRVHDGIVMTACDAHMLLELSGNGYKCRAAATAYVERSLSRRPAPERIQKDGVVHPRGR